MKIQENLVKTEVYENADALLKFMSLFYWYKYATEVCTHLTGK